MSSDPFLMGTDLYEYFKWLVNGYIATVICLKIITLLLNVYWKIGRCIRVSLVSWGGSAILTFLLVIVSNLATPIIITFVMLFHIFLNYLILLLYGWERPKANKALAFFIVWFILLYVTGIYNWKNLDFQQAFSSPKISPIPQAEITDTNFLESPQIDLEQLAIPSAKPQAEETVADVAEAAPVATEAAEVTADEAVLEDAPEEISRLVGDFLARLP